MLLTPTYHAPVTSPVDKSAANLQKDTKRAPFRGVAEVRSPDVWPQPGHFSALWVKSGARCARPERTPFLKETSMSAPHAASHDSNHDAPHDVVEEIVPMMPIVLPIAGAVLMFLLAFIAVSMA